MLFTNAALLASLLSTALGFEEIHTFGTPEASIASDDVVNTDFAGSDSFKPDHGKDVLIASAATCPDSYPLYCSRYDFCCPSNAVGCCANACCGSGTQYCGNDGHCYGRRA